MNKAHDKVDGCSTSQAAAATFEQFREPGRSPLIKYVTGVALLVVAWWMIYRQLEPFAAFFTSALSHWAGFSPEGHLASAIAFFVFETPKVLMLLTLVVFGVGIVRSFFTPERDRKSVV